MKGLTESTLDGYFKKTVELLKLLYEELKQEVFSGQRIFLVGKLSFKRIA